MNLRAAAILSTALLLSACGGDGGSPVTAPTPAPTPSPPPAASATVTVTIPMGASILTSTAFAPNPLTASVGTTLTFINNDTTTHDATDVGKSFATGLIAPGGSAAVTLRTAGSFQYYCTLHSGMTGTLTVQ